MPAFFGLVLLLLLGCTPVAAQTPPPPRTAGPSLQAYPAGFITGVRLGYGLRPSDAIAVYAAYNTTDRRDWGEQDNEEGGGPGFGIAWRHYWGANQSGLHAGVRVDLWFLGIDWRDRRANLEAAGETDITVLQPTVQAGYTYLLGSQQRWQVAGTVALGREVNVRTDGEDVGQGAILLGGVGLAYRF